MKPRSSGEIAMRSSGRSFPLKWAMGAVMGTRSGRGMEEEAQRVPPAGEEPRDGHVLEGDDGVLGDGRVIAHELHYPRFLPGGKRRDQGLARLDHGADSAEMIAREREPHVVLEA